MIVIDLNNPEKDVDLHPIHPSIPQYKLDILNKARKNDLCFKLSGGLTSSNKLEGIYRLVSQVTRFGGVFYKTHYNTIVDVVYDPSQLNAKVQPHTDPNLDEDFDHYLRYRTIRLNPRDLELLEQEAMMNNLFHIPSAVIQSFTMYDISILAAQILRQQGVIYHTRHNLMWSILTQSSEIVNILNKKFRYDHISNTLKAVAPNHSP
jgi:hypothetical protein